MANCKACGEWFSSSNPRELCPSCERALKRLDGYAVPVVRCKDCIFYRKTKDWDSNDYYACHKRADVMIMEMQPDNFCCWGERRKKE